MMKTRVKEFLSSTNLLDNNSLYLVGLSGGADSVALLVLMHEMGYHVHAAHCNFQLRGEESLRDEEFCVNLCKELAIPIHLVHFDTLTYASLHKVSIEMAARELRYRWFESLRNDIGAAGICVAHHRDDSVETVLMNLLRGTGLRGLTGIQPRHGYVLRPLLCVTRKEIEDYLAEKGQSYVTDSTNLKPDVLRNAIRLHVIPLLKSLNPAAVDNIQRTAMNLSEAQSLLDTVMESYRDVRELDLNELEKTGSVEYIVYEWLKKYGFNGNQISQVMTAQTGKVFSSVLGYDVLCDRRRLIIEPSLEPLKSVKILEPGAYCLEDGSRIVVKHIDASVDFLPSKQPDVATLDASKVSFPLVIRRAITGDRMMPFGMRGQALLSDMMTNRKMSVFQKRRQLVVLDARGQVLWLVGIRIDARVAVGEDTREVLSLRFVKDSE